MGFRPFVLDGRQRAQSPRSVTPAVYRGDAALRRESHPSGARDSRAAHSYRERFKLHGIYHLDAQRMGVSGRRRRGGGLRNLARHQQHLRECLQPSLRSKAIYRCDTAGAGGPDSSRRPQQPWCVPARHSRSSDLRGCMGAVRACRAPFWGGFDSYRMGRQHPGVRRACGDRRRGAPTLQSRAGGDERLSASERIAIYANAYFYRLLDCLRDDFPATAAVVGASAFEELARAYLRRYRPTEPSIFHVGRYFANFLAEHPLLARWPFLSELARLERTL